MTIETMLPANGEMFRAVLERDTEYDGVFVVAVRTTGIFCRPTCPARKPRRENVEFFAGTRDALLAGHRACRRCCPLELRGRPPAWLEGLLAAVERDRVRRWFQREHGMTFHAYHRSRRLGAALGRLRHGEDLTRVALDHGFESLSGFRDAFQSIFGAPPGRARDSRPVFVMPLLTPLGPMLAAATDEGVCLLEFADRRMLETQLKRLSRYLRARFTPGSNDVLGRLDEELARYFEGDLATFTVPLEAPGTAFQREVWNVLRAVPYGETRSYADQARAIGRPGAVRAVGRASGDNRIAIVIPCHRVVGCDGKLTGYGGGLWRKRSLLDHERRTLATLGPAPTID